MSRPTEITIDLNALSANCHYAQSLSPDSQTVAVIKADAYGHGAVEIAKALQEQVAMFAVSSLEEGMELRKHGIMLPILLLEGCFTQDELIVACNQRFSVVMHNHEQLQMLNNLENSQCISIWIKVDTGMHRLGFPVDKVADVYSLLSATKQVTNVVLMTHLSVADEQDNPFTASQLQLFEQCRSDLENQFNAAIPCSIANSAGISAWPFARSKWNRPGIMLYGVSPFMQKDTMQPNLQPVMTFKSKVIAMRTVLQGESVGYGNTWQAEADSLVATVAVGYGDGYPRNAKLGTPVLVNGQRAKLCGRVSMDMITIDVTGLKEIKMDSEVELWGKDLLANEVATWANTIGYELVTRMPKRTRRRIINQ